MKKLVPIVPVTAALVGCVAPMDETMPEGSAGASGETVISKEQAIFGSNACKDPNIYVLNYSDENIRVLYLKYEDLTSDVTREEDIPNTIIPPYTSGLFGGPGSQVFHDTLENTKDHYIGEWQIKYDYYRNGSWHGPNWTGWESDYYTYNRKCVSGAGTYYEAPVGIRNIGGH